MTVKTADALPSTSSSNPFELYIGKYVVFGPPNSVVRYHGKVTAVSGPGWTRIAWPDSEGRAGWRNTHGYIIHEVGV